MHGNHELDLPHIRSRLDDEHRVVVEVDDTELFDFVEDFLCEEHDLDHETVGQTIVDGCPRYLMRFSASCTLDEVNRALDQLDPIEVEKIFRLNNP